MNKIRNLLLTTFLAVWSITASIAATQQDFLPAADAFATAVSAEGTSAVLQVTIAPGYHLYRDRFTLRGADGAPLAAMLPAGHTVFDKVLGEQVSIWEGKLSIPVPGPVKDTDWALTMQGCADEGLCYPPQHLAIHWRMTGSGMAATVADAEPDASAAAGPPAAVPAAAATAVAAPAAGQDRASAALASGNGLTVFGVFVAFGLLLSFTPCVLPMLPILSSIIVGQGQATSRARGFSLALSYSLGMALVYTAMGMLAGWLGQGLAGALQQPWVLSGFALVLVAFSLSMFGVWEFQAPAFIQERLSSASGLMRGGNYLGVFVMGSLSALICGPCVAPPLAGVLVYISQAHDFVLGGLALFALATGMSVPLLLLGVSAGRLLPRAGAWMERVKIVFGILLMATALWLVAPVMPTSATMAILGAALLFGAGLLFWSADRPAAWARAAVVPVAVLGSIYLVGALSGGQDMLHPLARTASDNPAATLKTAQSDFIKVRSEEEFAAAIGRAQGRTIVVDYYADWCVSCKEMEHLTFADAAVQEKLRQALLLRVDVTEDNPASRSLLKRFGLFGPPGIVFLDAQGREKTHELRVIGYMNSEQFLLKLAGAGLS